MSDLEDLDDELLELELAALEDVDVEDSEEDESYLDPNCFCVRAPEFQWQWDQLEELSGESLTLNCHFLFRFNGVFTDENTKLKRVDLSKASCKFDHLLDFLEVLLTTQESTLETLYLPNVESNDSYLEIFEKLEKFKQLRTVDFSHCIEVDFNIFERELFESADKWKRIENINLSKKLRSSDKDFDSLGKIKNVPIGLKTLHIGVCESIPESILRTFRNIVIHVDYPKTKIPIPSFRKVEQYLFNPSSLTLPSVDFDDSKDTELIKEEVSNYWECSELKKLTANIESKIKVAILDSGLHVCHSNLTKKVRGFKSFTEDGSLAQSDVIGRGTHCAGLISIVASDRVEFLIGKICENNGNITETALSKALNWASSEGADIICIPSALTGSNNELYKSINSSLGAGKIIISGAAPGKQGYKNIGYPAKYGNTICVAGESIEGKALKGYPSGREIEFIAPGKEIWSMGLSKKYSAISGPAPAVAQVTGLCSLLLAYDRQNDNLIANCETMKKVLRGLSACVDGHDSVNGYGSLIPSRVFTPNSANIREQFNKLVTEGFEY